jgi:Zn-dependent protease with chaperone function
MAIASGVAVPPVFLLRDEEGINAFAAGYSPNDAVIGVTRGAVEKLTRDQLQGVIAHEFSHVLNGDMRLGIRLIGVLHGILLLGLTGRMIFQMVAFGGASSRRSSRSGSSRGGGGGGQAILIILAVGAVLLLVGTFGSFVGSMIKAAVSRQREYLADAAAVQFTRNPGGLAGALKRIGAVFHGAVVRAPGSSEASHLFFAEGVTWGLASMFATHPPLPKRIRAIEPNWDGSFPEPETFLPHEQVAGLETAALAGFATAPPAPYVPPKYEPEPERAGPAEEGPSVEQIRAAIARVGDPDESHCHYARQLIASLPTRLREAAHDPYEARALIFALLLNHDEPALRKQLRALHANIEPQLVESTAGLAALCRQLEPRQRLPLVDMAVPALQAMTASQYARFERSFWALVEADERLSIFEWTLAQLIHRQLKSRFGEVESTRTRYYGLQKLGEPISLLLATLAHVGHNPEQSREAFELAATLVSEAEPYWVPEQECSLDALQEALVQLRAISPKLKARLVDACLAVVCADGVVRAAEAELLRGIADLMDCPVPPVLPGQRTAEMLAG